MFHPQSSKVQTSKMNIEGLDYNTQREKLVLPQYGREIQDMLIMRLVCLQRRNDSIVRRPSFLSWIG